MMFHKNKNLMVDSVKLKLIVLFVILVVMSSNVSAEDNGKGFVTGRAISPSGKPMQNAAMLFYEIHNGPAPLPVRYWRVPDAVVPIESDGKFTAELLEGEYYVGAIGRESSQLVPGPPIEGDLLILLKEKSGKPKSIVVTNGSTINIGTQTGRAYNKSGRNGNIKITTVEGKITSPEGLPLSGAIVFAFHSPERGSKPVFASDKTDKNGNYVLKLDGNGVYYLKVRDSYGGGKPQVGQLMGVYGGDEPTPVVVVLGGRLKGIDIKSQPVQRMEGN
jgi:hypothetical protein